MTIKSMFNSSASFLFSDAATGTGKLPGPVADQKSRVLKITAAIEESGDDFAKHLKEASDAKLTSQYAVMQCAIDLEALFGEEELKSWPIVGSESGNNPDKYTIMVKVDGEMKSKKVDFYSEIIERLPKGRELVAIIEAVKIANANSGTCDHPAVMALRRPEDRNDLRNTCKQELSTAKSVLRNTMKYYQTLWAVEAMPKVSVDILLEPVYEMVTVDGKQEKRQAVQRDEHGEPVLDADGEMLPVWRPRKTPKPIKVANANDAAEFELYSISSFTTLNVEDAIAKGGTFADLKATKQRERDEGDDDAENDGIPVNNINQVESAFAGLAGWLEKDENSALLLKKLKAKPTENLGYIESIRELYINLTGIMPTINKLWDKEQERIDTEAKVSKTAA